MRALSVTAAGHASGRVPAEAEATPVVANSAYRKSTPRRRRRRSACIKPCRASHCPIIATVVGKSEEEVASNVRPSVGPSVNSPDRSPVARSERDVALQESEASVVRSTTSCRHRITRRLTRKSTQLRWFPAAAAATTETHHRNSFDCSGVEKRIDIENRKSQAGSTGPRAIRGGNRLI